MYTGFDQATEGEKAADATAIKALNDKFSVATNVGATDTYGILESALGQSNVQALIDEIANRVMNQLLAKSAMSNVQINDQNHVPTSGLVYSMNETITQLNSDKIPYVNYQATAGTNIDDAIKAGLDSTNQQTACILRVYIPSTAVYVLSVGYNSGIYSAYGIQVADPSNKLQLVYYSSDDNYKRSTISPA